MQFKNNPYHFIFISFIFILFISFSCKKEKTKDCEACFFTNDDRIENSIPIINKNWKRLDNKNTYHNDIYECIWGNPELENLLKKRVPFYAKKLIKIKNYKLYEEYDIYYSRNKVLDDWGDPGNQKLDFQTLTIAYNYEKQEWSISSYHCPECDKTSKFLSLKDADLILKKWGIERLNY